MVFRMESEQITREHSPEEFFTPWADRHGVWVWPRDVPEKAGQDLGSRLAHKLGEKRQMIILNEGRCGSAGEAGRIDKRPCEFVVYTLVCAPIGLSKDGSAMGQMAKGPEAFIRKPPIITGLFLLADPNSSLGDATFCFKGGASIV